MNSPERGEMMTQSQIFQDLLRSYLGEDAIISARLRDFLPQISTSEPYENALEVLGEKMSLEELNELFESVMVTAIHPGEKLLFVYDETECFSEARLKTLENYPDGIQLGYPIKYWVRSCRLRTNAKQTGLAKAISDMLTDVEGAKAGYRVIRVEAGEFEWTNDSIALLDRLVSNAENSNFLI